VDGPIGRKIASDTDPDRVFVDFDPLAIFIGGIGDRVFIMKPPMAAVLLSGERSQQWVFSDPKRREWYAELVGAHKFPQTLFYQNGGRVQNITKDELNIHIYRGRFTLSEIAEEMRSDMRATPSEEARSFLNALLLDLRAVN
jgi:hypothetical protein